MANKDHLNHLQIKVRPKGLHKSLTPDPWPLTSTKDYVRKNNLFMQNEPKFRKSQMNLNKVLARDYEERALGESGKNEPN